MQILTFKNFSIMKRYKLFILWDGKKRMTFECDGLSKVGLKIKAESLKMDVYIGHLIKDYSIK